MKPPEMNHPTDLRGMAASVAARVQTSMRSDLDAALAGSDPLLVAVLHYALFNGGKRIRPLLTVHCSRCCGRDDESLYLLAAGFEYLHVATLVHDDVIDRAEQRLARQEAHGGGGGEQIGDALVGARLVLDADAEPDVGERPHL